MLSLTLLRDKPEFIVERLAVKHFDAKGVVDRILQLDEDRRKVQAELDQLLNQQIRLPVRSANCTRPAKG